MLIYKNDTVNLDKISNEVIIIDKSAKAYIFGLSEASKAAAEIGRASCRERVCR